MTYLFSIGPITFDLASLISFIIGIGFGGVIFALLYIYAVVRSLNKSIKRNKVQEEDIDEEEIKGLILSAQNEFKDKKLRAEEGYGKMLFRISKSIAVEIASKFYPKSKRPLLELTIDEVILLLNYVSKRVDEILSHRILRLFRGLTITRIMQINDAKDVITQNMIVKGASKGAKVASKALMVVNMINPVFWFRKIVVDKMTKIVMQKLGLAIIAITGEETYKIYSKKVFDETKEVDSGVDAIYDEIGYALQEVASEEKK